MRRPLRTSPLVDAWFDLLPPVQQPLSRALHKLLLELGPQLMPAVKWGTMGYMQDESMVIALAPHRVNMQLQIAQGAQLQLRFPELEGTARMQRHLRLRWTKPMDEELVRDLVKATLALPPPRERPPRHA